MNVNTICLARTPTARNRALIGLVLSLVLKSCDDFARSLVDELERSGQGFAVTGIELNVIAGGGASFKADGLANDKRNGFSFCFADRFVRGGPTFSRLPTFGALDRLVPLPRRICLPRCAAGIILVVGH